MSASPEYAEPTVSKAGRHRLYSNEQRKDRNRQAQAAFRDRRTKYQKTLESAMLKYEDTIENLKQDNQKTVERAEHAERRIIELDSEVAQLQNLLQVAMQENQRLLSNTFSPASPSFSLPESPAQTLLFPTTEDLFDTTWLHQQQQGESVAIPFIK